MKFERGKNLKKCDIFPSILIFPPHVCNSKVLSIILFENTLHVVFRIFIPNILHPSGKVIL